MASRNYAYSNEEFIAMVQFYAIAGYNSQAARRLYSDPNHLQSLRLRGIPNPQIPSGQTIVAATQRLKDHGQFLTPSHAQGRGREPVYIPELDLDENIEYFERDPRRSTNRAAISFNDDSSLIKNEIKVFCPQCDTDVSQTAKEIQKDQTKTLIAKVYHYFVQEYEELKTIYGDLDLTPLSKFRQRTALATGVSEKKILQILKEEEGRNADKRQERPQKRRRALKRCRQTDSSSKDDHSDDYADDNKQSSNVHSVAPTLVKIESPEYYNEEPEIYVSADVKVEPSEVELNKEQAQTDPISLDVKTEPRSDVVDNTDETLAVNEPAGTKRKARKKPRRSDVTSTRRHTQSSTMAAASRVRLKKELDERHTQGEFSTMAAASSVRLKEELDENILFYFSEIKAEEIDIHEEGVS